MNWRLYEQLSEFYEKVTAFKKKGIKVLIAIGGWNDSAGDKYSKLVNNPTARRRFITHVEDFVLQNNFDGLDLDWEYPKCWQVDCNKGPASDKEAFADFVRELSESFKPKGLLLSSAVSPSKRVIDAGYDVPTLSRYLDWIAVMCYDYHGQWDKITGHVAPMYAHPEDIDVTFNSVRSRFSRVEVGFIYFVCFVRISRYTTGSSRARIERNWSWACRCMDNRSRWPTMRTTG